MLKVRKNTIAYKTLIITTLFILGSAIIAGITMFSKAPSAEAASSYSTCLNGYSANGHTIDGSQVDAIRNACGYCHNDGRVGPFGVLWFNDSMDDPNGNTVHIDSWTEVTKQVVLWGGVYSCQSTSSAENWAHYVWFGLPGQMKGNGTSLSGMEGYADFFDLSTGYAGTDVYSAVYRGKLPGTKYTWSNFSIPYTPGTAPGGSYTLPNYATFYPNKFREAAMGMSGSDGGCETITNADGSEGLKCHMKISVNRCYSPGTNNKYVNTNNSPHTPGSSTYQRCYGDPSELILIAPPYPNEEGEFSSKSKVTNGTDTSESPNWNQDADTIEIEADASGAATVTFSHKLKYEILTPSGNYNDASTDWTITIDDGSGGPWTGTWSTNGGSTNESGWLPAGDISTTVNLGSDTEKTVCSTIEYIPKTVQWDGSDPKSTIANTDPSNKGSTKACAKVVRAVTESVGYIEFWSESEVRTTGQDVPAGITSDITIGAKKRTESKTTGQVAKVFISTNYSYPVKITYEHFMDYEWHLNSGITFGTYDTFANDICTSWSIDPTRTGGTGTFCYDPSTTVPKSVTTYDTTVPAPGTSQEKITYTSKRLGILRTAKYDAPCGTTPDPHNCLRYEYKAGAGYGDSGNSAARIEVEVPDDPDPLTPSGPHGPWQFSTGSTDIDILYAGETEQIGWDIKAKSYATRRIMEAHPYVYQVPVTVDANADTTKGVLNHISAYSNSNAPCDWYRTKSGNYRNGACQIYNSITEEMAGDSLYPTGTTILNYEYTGEHPKILVPDHVGDKYCNTYGIKWQYFWGAQIDDRPITWTAGHTYWTIYHSACHAIAKKPTVNVWNGNFITEGTATTSVSKRFINPVFGTSMSTITTGNPERYRFGSWTEHMNVINGTTNHFASGAALAFKGLPDALGAADLIKYSPITIANNDSNNIGDSGITNSSTYISRLSAYLYGNASDITVSTDIANAYTHSSGTLVINVSGDAIISQPIKMPSTSYATVYDLPQVVVHATGDIYINPSVTQIDAWLITESGTVYTCKAGAGVDTFKEGDTLTEGGTQAYVQGYPVTSIDSTNPDGSVCAKPLQINGPVIAKRLVSQRTAGSDPLTYEMGTDYGIGKGDDLIGSGAFAHSIPAETFNLSANTYLWAYAQAGRYKSSYTEAYTRELPPRY